MQDHLLLPSPYHSESRQGVASVGSTAFELFAVAEGNGGCHLVGSQRELYTWWLAMFEGSLIHFSLPN